MKYLKSLLLLTLLILLALQSKSQDIPVTFKDIQPKWTTYIKPKVWEHRDPNGIISTYFPLYNENDGYFLYNIFDSLIFMGYHLAKIDLNSGDILWENGQPVNDVFNRIYGSYMRLSADNNPQVLLHHEYTKDFNNPFAGFTWGLSTMGTIEFDKNSGEIVNVWKADSSDTNVPKVYYPEIQASNYYISSFWVDSMFINTTVHASLYENDYSILFHNEYMDNKGLLQRRDSIVFDLSPNYYPVQFKTLELEDNKIAIIIQSIDYTLNTQEVKLFLVDVPSLTTLKTYDLSNYFSDINIRYYIRSYSKDGFIVEKSDISKRVLQDVSLYHFDNQGSLIENFTLKEISTFPTLLVLPNKQILVVPSKNERLNKFVFYKSDGNGNIELIKTLETQNPDDVIYLFKMHLINDSKDLLIEMIHRSYKRYIEAPFNHPVWTAVTLFPDINSFITGTEELGEYDNISLYPNPATNLVHIQGIEEDAKIVIYNLQGIKISEVQIKDESIDVSHLNSGMYILGIHSKYKILKQKLIKL